VRAVAHWRLVDGASVVLMGSAAGVIALRWPLLFGVGRVALLASIGVAVAAALVWFVGLRPRLAVRYYRYELTDDAVYTQRGLVTRTRAIVPYARIQSTKTTAGPIERWMGLTTLVFVTAAGSHRIAMLDEEIADELRDRVGALAREAHDDL
jgi:uncharacterized protein